MVVGFKLAVQSVPITTKVASSNPAHGEVYSIQHFVINFVSNLQLVAGFLLVLRASSTNLNWPLWYQWNIVESGIKHHNHNSILLTYVILIWELACTQPIRTLFQIITCCWLDNFGIRVRNVYSKVLWPWGLDDEWSQRYINAKEYRRDNEKWTIHRNWQHRVHKTKNNKAKA